MLLGCFDRRVVTGTLTEIAPPDAMQAFLYHEGFRAFDIALFAERLRERIRDNAVEVARRQELKSNIFRVAKELSKEDLVTKVVVRGRPSRSGACAFGGGKLHDLQAVGATPRPGAA